MSPWPLWLILAPNFVSSQPKVASPGSFCGRAEPAAWLMLGGGCKWHSTKRPGGLHRHQHPQQAPERAHHGPVRMHAPSLAQPKMSGMFCGEAGKRVIHLLDFFSPLLPFRSFIRCVCVVALAGGPAAGACVCVCVCVCEQACDEPGVTGPGRAAKVLSWCEPEIPSPPLQPFLEAAAGSVPAGCAPGAAVPVPAGSWRWRHGPAAGLRARAGDARTRAFHGGGQDNSHSCPPPRARGRAGGGHPPAVLGSRGGSGRGARARSASACPARAVAEVLFPGASSWEMAPAGPASSPLPRPRPCPRPGWGTGPGDTRPPGAAAAARAEARRHQVLLAEQSLLRNLCLI